MNIRLGTTECTASINPRLLLWLDPIQSQPCEPHTASGCAQLLPSPGARLRSSVSCHSWASASRWDTSRACLSTATPPGREPAAAHVSFRPEASRSRKAGFAACMAREGQGNTGEASRHMQSHTCSLQYSSSLRLAAGARTCQRPPLLALRQLGAGGVQAFRFVGGGELGKSAQHGRHAALQGQARAWWVATMCGWGGALGGGLSLVLQRWLQAPCKAGAHLPCAPRRRWRRVWAAQDPACRKRPASGQCVREGGSSSAALCTDTWRFMRPPALQVCAASAAAPLLPQPAPWPWHLAGLGSPAERLCQPQRHARQRPLAARPRSGRLALQLGGCVERRKHKA